MVYLNPHTFFRICVLWTVPNLNKPYSHTSTLLKHAPLKSKTQSMQMPFLPLLRLCMAKALPLLSAISSVYLVQKGTSRARMKAYQSYFQGTLHQITRLWNLPTMQSSTFSVKWKNSLKKYGVLMSPYFGKDVRTTIDLVEMCATRPRGVFHY